MKSQLVIALVLSLINLGAQAIEEKEITSKVNAVTVYIEGAQITREKQVYFEKGLITLNFSKLSPFIDPKSIRVNANGPITILSVNHQRNYNDTLRSGTQSKQLVAQIYKLNKQILLERTQIAIIKDEIEFLHVNRQIGGSEKELSLANYRSTAEFYHNKLSELKFKEIEHTEKITLLSRKKTLASKKLSDLRGKKFYPSGEIHIKVDASVAANAKLTISYKVSNAGWFPSYDIRHTNLDKPLELTYKANIRQDTKVDWKDVKITFSSNKPIESMIAPRLKTYFLSYYTQPPSYSMAINQVQGTVYSNNDNLPLPGASVLVKGTTIGTISDLDGRYSLTLPNNHNNLSCSFVGYLTDEARVTNEITNFRLVEDISALEEVVVVGYGTQKKTMLTGAVSTVDLALSGKAPGVRIRGASSNTHQKQLPTSIPLEVIQKAHTTNFEFQIETPYTISSNNRSYTINMSQHQLTTNYEYVCSPKISTDAFLIASIPDFEKLNLLEGEVNLFFEDTYIGKSILDLRQNVDTLKISLGKDKNLIVSREIKEDFQEKKIIGNKRTDTKAWEISIKNNKPNNVHINIYDQIPVSMLDEIEIKPELISQGGILNKDSGQISWKLSVEPESRETAELIYKVIYPKHQNLTIE